MKRQDALFETYSNNATNVLRENGQKKKTRGVSNQSHAGASVETHGCSINAEQCIIPYHMVLPRAGKMKRILCSDWLYEQARWAYFACLELPAFVSAISV